MPVPSGTWMAQVDVLLRVLTIEVDIVRRFT